jgi:hypothetical protein
MSSYKDKTFCPYYEFCRSGKTCPHALTPKVKEDAKVWWLLTTKGKSEDAPIAVHAAIPPCFEAKE